MLFWRSVRQSEDLSVKQLEGWLMTLSLQLLRGVHAHPNQLFAVGHEADGRIQGFQRAGHLYCTITPTNKIVVANLVEVPRHFKLVALAVAISHPIEVPLH